MTEQNPTDVATAYFDALGRGDVPLAMSHLDPDVVWSQPGANQFSGQHHGIEGVGQLLQAMMTASGGSFQLQVAGAAMVNGDLVAVPVRFSGRREGFTMDMGGIDLLTIRTGKIVHVHLVTEDAAAEDAFWGIG